MANVQIDHKGFKAGAVESLGITVAFVFLFISVGALCFRGGLDFWQSVGMTALIIAAPLQIVLLNHVHGLTLWMAFIFSLIVNFRLVLMSAAMIPYLRDKTFIKVLFPLAVISASTFSIAFSEYKNNQHVHHFRYFLGATLGNYLAAVIATGVGFAIANGIHSVYVVDVLSMILPINFAILTAKYWPKWRPLVATLLGFLLMPLARQLSPEWGMLILGLAIGLVFMLTLRRKSCTSGG